MLIISYSYLQLALLQPQKVGHVVTINPENAERMKGIVTKIAIANRVLSAEEIIAPLVSHQALTAAINHAKTKTVLVNTGKIMVTVLDIMLVTWLKIARNPAINVNFAHVSFRNHFPPLLLFIFYILWLKNK